MRVSVLLSVLYMVIALLSWSHSTRFGVILQSLRRQGTWISQGYMIQRSGMGITASTFQSIISASTSSSSALIAARLACSFAFLSSALSSFKSASVTLWLHPAAGHFFIPRARYSRIASPEKECLHTFLEFLPRLRSGELQKVKGVRTMSMGLGAG